MLGLYGRLRAFALASQGIAAWTIEDESEGMGKVSMFPEMFFGTTDPFYPQLYRDVLLESATDVSPEAAVAALKNAIARFDTTTAS
jgi:hypothetical protein